SCSTHAVLVAEAAVIPTADLCQVVLARTAAVLGVQAEKLRADSPFTELGVDSLVAPVLASDLSRHLGTDVLPTDLYNFPSPRALADWAAGPRTSIADKIEPEPSESRQVAVIGMSGRFPG